MLGGLLSLLQTRQLATRINQMAATELLKDRDDASEGPPLAFLSAFLPTISLE